MTVFHGAGTAHRFRTSSFLGPHRFTDVVDTALLAFVYRTESIRPYKQIRT